MKVKILLMLLDVARTTFDCNIHTKLCENDDYTPAKTFSCAVCPGSIPDGGNCASWEVECGCTTHISLTASPPHYESF